MIPTQAQYDAAVKATTDHLIACKFKPYAGIPVIPVDADPGTRAAWNSMYAHSGYPLWYGTNEAFHNVTKSTAVGQRELNDKSVVKLRRVIRDGGWRPLNAEPVVFTWAHPTAAGDGNTRLHAFANSGHGGLITVMAGADPDWLLAQLDKNADKVPQALGRLATDNPAFVNAVPSYRIRESIAAVVRVHFSASSPRSGAGVRDLPNSVYARKIIDNLDWLSDVVGPFPKDTVCAAPVVRYAFSRAYDDPSYAATEVLAAATAFANPQSGSTPYEQMFATYRTATLGWRSGITRNNLTDEEAVQLFVQTARYLDAMKRKQYGFVNPWPTKPFTDADVQTAMGLTVPMHWGKLTQ